MAGSLLAAVGTAVGAAWAVAACAVVIAVATLIGLARQRAVLVRLDERLTHLTAALSLLTTTTEEGWRSVAEEIARRGAALPAAAGAASIARSVEPPRASLRERIARAAAHGRTVQDIAASEQVSEGEVLLHLLLEKLQPEGSHAAVC